MPQDGPAEGMDARLRYGTIKPDRAIPAKVVDQVSSRASRRLPNSRFGACEAVRRAVRQGANLELN